MAGTSLKNEILLSNEKRKATVSATPPVVAARGGEDGGGGSVPSNQRDKGADVGWALTLSSPQRQGGSARSALAAKQHKTSSRNFKQPLGRSGLQTAKQASGGSPEVGGCAGKLTAQLVVDSRDRVSPSAIAIDRGLVADQLHLMACGIEARKRGVQNTRHALALALAHARRGL